MTSQPAYQPARETGPAERATQNLELLETRPVEETGEILAAGLSAIAYALLALRDTANDNHDDTTSILDAGLHNITAGMDDVADVLAGTTRPGSLARLLAWFRPAPDTAAVPANTEDTKMTSTESPGGVYYMFAARNQLESGRVIRHDPDLRIAAAPRQLRPSDDPDLPGAAAVITGQGDDVPPGGYCLGRLAPLGPVTPWQYEADGKTVTDDRYATCRAGWAVEAAEPLDALLGPQAPQIIEAVKTAEQVLIGDDTSEADERYAIALDAQYGDGYPPWKEQHSADAAQQALEAVGADGWWWANEFSCAYGPEMLALAARDLIGTVPGWDRAAYDRLTQPWRTTFGPIHPADPSPASAARTA